MSSGIYINFRQVIATMSVQAEKMAERKDSIKSLVEEEKELMKALE